MGTALVVDGARPAVDWVTSLPAAWTPDSERIVLLVLACDSYDGKTTKPGMDAVARWAGIARSTAYAVIDSLCAANDVRPALLERDSTKGGRGKRSTYRFTYASETVRPDRTVQDAEPSGKPSGNRPVTVRPDRTVSPPKPSGNRPMDRTQPFIPENPSSPRVRLRERVTTLTGWEKDDERLNHIDELITPDVKNPDAWLRTLHANGDLVPRLTDAATEAAAAAARAAKADSLRCPHGVVHGLTIEGQCPDCTDAGVFDPPPARRHAPDDSL